MEEHETRSTVPQPPDTSPPPPRFRVVKGFLALILGVVSIIVGEIVGSRVAAMLGEGDGLISIGNITLVAVRGLAAVGAFLLLGGKRWLRFDKTALQKSWKFMLPLLLINVGLAGLIISAVFVPESLGGNGGKIAPDALKNILLSTVMMILVGINEEVIFRGLGYGGLLLWFGNKKYGVLIASILSSLVFGYIHVMSDIDITNPSTLIMGALKTLEAGMLGFMFSHCISSNKNLWGAVTAHAFYDWVIVASELLNQNDIEINYVNVQDDLEDLQYILFVVLILIYLPRTIKAFRRLRIAKPTYGPFGE